MTDTRNRGVLSLSLLFSSAHFSVVRCLGVSTAQNPPWTGAAWIALTFALPHILLCHPNRPTNAIAIAPSAPFTIPLARGAFEMKWPRFMLKMESNDR